MGLDPQDETLLFQLALMHKEMFDTYMRAGFSEHQTLILIANYMAAVGAQQPGEED